MVSSEPEILVMPVERSGTWAVREGAALETVSEYPSETDAVNAARERARAAGVERVLVRDRYFRTRAIRAAAARHN